MKKIFAMVVAMSCLFGLASCGDDDDYKATQLSTIKVLSAETSLQSRPDTGSVVLDCNPVQAYVAAEDKSWLDVEIKGDSVKFYAKQNESTESRNAQLTVKKNDNDSITLNIDQLGMIFIVEKKVDIVQGNDNAKDYYFNVRTDYQGKILSTPDWMDADFTGSRLNIHVDKNDEGHMREGYVAYGCGNFKDSVKVTQYDLEKDILGDYELWVGYDPATDHMDRKIPVTLVANASGGIYMTFTALYDKTNTSVDLTFPMTFDDDSVSFSIESSQQVGSLEGKRGKWTYFYTMFASPTGAVLPQIDENKDTIMRNTSGKITAYMKYDKKKKATFGSFSGLAYNEGGYTADFKRMYIGAFTTTTPKKKALVDDKWWTSLYDMVLVRKDK